MNLSELRAEIDAIDRQLLPLLEARMNCSEQVAAYKRQEGLPVLHPAREREILEEVERRAAHHAPQLAAVYRAILQVSRALQQDRLGADAPLRDRILAAADTLPTGAVACFGAQGAFCHQVAKSRFPSSPLQFYGRFADVFAAVEAGEAVLGVVPVENSNAGSVDEVYDLILQYRHFIVASAVLPVRQNLLGLPGASLEQITDVYSHPQALSQCAAYLETLGAASHTCESTAAAARQVRDWQNPARAAVGSREAAALYGLQVLAADIQTVAHNFTRFIVISRTPVTLPDSNKISVVFTLPHVTGSLYQVLDRFAVQGLNLTKIESRAVGNGSFEYQFYLDFTGRVAEPETVSLLAALSQELPEFCFLGNYPETVLD